MAGNDWINSYLEAILDVGPGIDEAKSAKPSPSLLLRERGHFSPTRYFVEEVITGFDESDLYRSWVKVINHLLTSTLNLSNYGVSFYDLELLVMVVVVVMIVRSRLQPPEVPRRGILDWRICAGGFGT